LLRALESDEVKAVGAPRPRRVDVRIVCASHRDLREMVDAGTFREDLYWRLRGVIIHIAPLRERPGDILPIAERFLAECTPGEFVSFSPDAREALQRHGWPGNVRELKQVVRLAVLLREGAQIRRRDLALDAAERRSTERSEGGALCCAEIEDPFPQPATDPDERGRGATGTTDPMFQLDLSRPLKLADVEEAAIRASHQRNRGVHRIMAVELGIARSSLLRKLDAFGLR
ncbi:MAG: sigma 54-interacting transcriptional regulator, partial [Deltaproteobacteria bacterium]|nr:sigma 54-interacting transcriptional regulator [Deltaproteobacteria bacterium]